MTTLTISYTSNDVVITGTTSEVALLYGHVFKGYGFSWWPRDKVWRCAPKAGNAVNRGRAFQIAQSLSEFGLDVVISRCVSDEEPAHSAGMVPRLPDEFAGNDSTGADALRFDLGYIENSLTMANDLLGTASRTAWHASTREADPVALSCLEDLAKRFKLKAQLSAVTARGVSIEPRIVASVTYDSARLRGNEQTRNRDTLLVFGQRERYSIVDSNSFAVLADSGLSTTYTFVSEGTDADDEELTRLRLSVHYWERRLVCALNACSCHGRRFDVSDIVSAPVHLQKIVNRMLVCDGQTPVVIAEPA